MCIWPCNVLQFDLPRCQMLIMSRLYQMSMILDTFDSLDNASWQNANYLNVAHDAKLTTKMTPDCSMLE